MKKNHRSSSNRTMRPGRYKEEIRQRLVFYAPDQKKCWSRMWKKWKRSGRQDRSVWKEFAPVLDIPGFRFDVWNGGRFAESVVALKLHRKGYTCFRAVSLFRRGHGQSAEVYEPVEALLKNTHLPRPKRFTKRITPVPRNPDLAAYHPNHGWRFCEVKWKRREAVSKGQLAALAVLRKLLRARVEVVRVAEESDRHRWYQSSYVCDYRIK